MLTTSDERRKTRRSVVAAALGPVAVGLLLVPASPARAVTDTQLFEYTGTPASFTVPDAVTAITVVVNGAQGGGGFPGFGAKVTTTLAVTPGQILQITAGGTGAIGAGGFNGGGQPGAPGSGGVGVNYGGGGASDIRTGACAATLSCGLASRVVTAGGGGGGDIVIGAWGTPIGGAGGTPTSQPGGDSRATGGTAATTTTPGAGGNPGPGSGNGTAGGDGTLGTGGSGGYNNVDDPGPAWCAGAGGGGGHYGGGGGGAANGPCETGAGGAGGSSRVDPATTTATSYATNRHGGPGSILITPSDPGAPTVSAGAATDLTGPGAALHGVVNTNGSETSAWFETATDPNFELLRDLWPATPETITGNTDTAVTANATDLDWPGDIIYVRLRAENQTGHTYSPTTTFTTAGPPDKPAAPAAWASGNPTGINVSWTEPETNRAPVTGYTITAAPGGAGCTTGADTLACTVTGLDPATNYAFTLIASSAAGPSPSSNPSTSTSPTPQPLLITGDNDRQVLFKRATTLTFTLSSTTVTGETINPNLPGSIELTHGDRVLCRATVDQGRAACTLRVDQLGSIHATARFTGAGAANQARAATTITLHAARATIKVRRVSQQCPARVTVTGETTRNRSRITLQQLITRHHRTRWRTIKNIQGRVHTYQATIKPRSEPTITLRARTGGTPTTPVSTTSACRRRVPAPVSGESRRR